MDDKIDIESWIIELLDDIKEAGTMNENFDLHLEAVYVKDIAEAIENIQWIEIY